MIGQYAASRLPQQNASINLLQVLEQQTMVIYAILFIALSLGPITLCEGDIPWERTKKGLLGMLAFLNQCTPMKMKLYQLNEKMTAAKESLNKIGEQLKALPDKLGPKIDISENIPKFKEALQFIHASAVTSAQIVGLPETLLRHLQI